MKVAFIGQQILQPSGVLRENLAAAVRELIEKENADEFLFVGRGDFDGLCFDVVSVLKAEYPHLRRAIVRGNDEYITPTRAERLRAQYDVVYPDEHCGAKVVSFFRRYRAAAAMSDVIVACFEGGGARLGKSAPALALKEAKEEKKRVLDLMRIS